MRKSVLILTALLAVSACGYQHRPILTIDDPTPHWIQTLPPQRVEDLILSACMSLGWKTQHIADGHLLAIQSREKFSATVDIYFDPQHWQIRYNDSVGLNAENGTIHSHYNGWVHNLEHEIQLRFTSVLPAAGP